MPQAAIELGFNVDELTPQQKRVVLLLTEVYDLTKKLDGIKVSPIDISGFGQLNKVAQEQNNLLTQANKTITDYTKSQIAQAKATKANADAQKAITQSENEVIKQISLETDAQKKLEQQAQKTAKAKQDAADIPFTSNVSPEGAIIEPTQGKTSGSIVSDAEIAATQKQLDVQRELDDEVQKSIPVVKEASDSAYAIAGAYDKYTGSLLENLKAFTENSDLLAQNRASQKEIKAAIDTQNGATDAQISKLAELKTAETALSETNKTLGVTVRNQAREQAAASGSLEQLQAQLNLTQAAYTKLSEEGRQSAFGLELKQQIDLLNPKVTELENSLGKFQRNVGNYTGSIKILTPALAEIAAKIDSFTAAGKENDVQVQKLKADYQTIEGILSQQQKGFASVTMELRSNQRALQTLSAAGLEDSEVFKQLQIETANVQRNFNELTQQTKLLASEAPGLGALGKVAQGIGSAYAVGAGAAQLFASDNEDVQKELTKLVAITTLLQGLGELNNVIKEKNAILTIAQVNATKLYNFVLNGSTVATEANTAAMTAGRIAAIGLRSALLLTGVGAAVVLIAALATSTNKFTGAAGKAAEELKDYGTTVDEIATGALNDLKQSQQEVNKELGINLPTAVDKAKKALVVVDAALAKTQEFRSGKGFHLFDAADYKDAFNQFTSTFGITEDNLTKLQKQQSDLRKAIQDKEAADRIKSFADELEAAQKAEIEISNITIGLQQDADQRIISNDKKSFAERTAALQDNLAERKALIQNELNIALSETGDPEKRKVAQAKANADSLKAERDYEDQLQSLQDAANEKSLEAYRKYLQDKHNLQKSEDERSADLFKAIADNDKNGATLRIGALQQYYDIEQKLIKDDADFQIQSQKLTGDAKLAVQIEAGTKLIQLQRAQQKQLQEIGNDAEPALPAGYKTKEQLDAEAASQKQAVIDLQKDLISITKDGSDEMAKVAETSFINEQTELETQYNSGLISFGKYQNALTDLVRKRTAEQLRIAIDAAAKQKALAPAGSKEFTDQENIIAKLKKSLADLGFSYNQIKGILQDLGNPTNLDKLKKTMQDIADITSNLTQAFTALSNIGFDNQKAELEEIGAQEEKNYEQAQNNIQKANLSDTDRAAKLQALDSAHAARQEEIARKQREADNKKAQFDKQVAILNIIVSTAAAVVKALPNIPLAVAVGILGAAELTAAVATKVPSYAKGTHDHKGGDAIVAEAGKKELVQYGSESYIYDRPTYIKNLPRHAKVIPLTENANVMANRAIGNGMIIQMQPQEMKPTADGWEIARWQTRQMKKVFAQQKRPIVNVYNNNDYLNKNVFHRK